MDPTDPIAALARSFQLPLQRARASTKPLDDAVSDAQQNCPLCATNQVSSAWSWPTRTGGTTTRTVRRIELTSRLSLADKGKKCMKKGFHTRWAQTNTKTWPMGGQNGLCLWPCSFSRSRDNEAFMEKIWSACKDSGWCTLLWKLEVSLKNVQG